MSLVTIADHTIDESSLSVSPVVLDVGCRGFGFGDGIKKLRPSARLFELDIDDLNDRHNRYIRAAICGKDGMVGVSDDIDLSSRHVTPSGSVFAFTLKTFSSIVKVRHWDVIKLDCEGSEFDILSSINGPVAQQITVEFHQHTAHGRRPPEEIASLLSRLSQWYEVVQHPFDERYGCGLNYWDTLLVAK